MRLTLLSLGLAIAAAVFLLMYPTYSSAAGIHIHIGRTMPR